jgi:hypothetical protein
MPKGRPGNQPRSREIGRPRADRIRTAQSDEGAEHEQGCDHDGRKSAPIVLPGGLFHANRMIRTGLGDGKDKETSSRFAMGEERV